MKQALSVPEMVGGLMQATADNKEMQFRMYKKYFMTKFYEIEKSDSPSIEDIKQLGYEIDKVVAQEGLEDLTTTTYAFGDAARKGLGLFEKSANIFKKDENKTNKYADRDAGSILLVSGSRLLITLMVLKTLLKIKADKLGSPIDSDSIDISGKSLDDIIAIEKSIAVGNTLEAQAYGLADRQKQAPSNAAFKALTTGYAADAPKYDPVPAVGGRRKRSSAKPAAKRTSKK